MVEIDTEIQGRILHLQRLSTEDGPGIRTTVFFKGCPLACEWCHNPESISSQPQLQWYSERCLGCNACLDACHAQALTRSDERLIINRKACDGCGVCADRCPANALEQLGKHISVNELIRELVKDRVYFEKSGGGVTLSGGEPGLQPNFTRSLLAGLHTQGIKTALDTCGFVAEDMLRSLLINTDVLLFDLKLIDEIEHRRFTGRSNELILSNLAMVAEYSAQNESPFELWIRTPLIPLSTATDANITSIGEYLSENLAERISRWELCSFNNLCRDKYTRLGMEWRYSTQPLMTRAELDHYQEVARACGLPKDRVMVTGAARIDE